MHDFSRSTLRRRRKRLRCGNAGAFICILACFLLLTFQQTGRTGTEDRPGSLERLVAVIPVNGPPSFYQDKTTGNAAGFAVEITDVVAKRAGYSVSYLFAANWEDIRKILQYGKADISPGLSISTEREQTYSFTEPFDIFTISFFSRTGASQLKQNALVGVLRGSVAYELLRPRPGIQLVLYDNFETGLFDLLVGRIDAFAGPAPVLGQLAMDAGVQDQVRVIEKPIAEVKRAFGARKGRAELVARLNKALDGFVGSPEYRKIYSKWYGKPKPFFSLSKQTIALVIVLTLLIAAMTAWRHLSVVNLTNRLRREIEEKKQSEKRYRQLFENMQEGFMIQDIIEDDAGKPVDVRYLDINPAIERFLGKTRAEIVGRTRSQVLGIPDPAVIEANSRVAATGQPLHMMRYSSGAGRWYESFSYSFGPGQVATLVLDTTERKQAEEKILRSLKEKEVMLKEIHHRVKNNMQVIYSLLNLQAKSVTDRTVRAMFEESRNRVNSMSLIHEKLYRSADLAHVDFKEYLQNLVSGISDTYKRRDVVLSVDMEPLALDVNMGIPCGLIVNELVSNCLKYAFPEGKTGSVRVGIWKNGESSYVLNIADNGIGFPEIVDFRNTATLGLQLVNVLVGQIQGSIELSREAGTTFSITFPGTPESEGERNG